MGGCQCSVNLTRGALGAAIHSKAVVLLLLIYCLVCFPLVVGVMCCLCFVMHYSVSIPVLQSS